jgi:hypothetical protein
VALFLSLLLCHLWINCGTFCLEINTTKAYPEQKYPFVMLNKRTLQNSILQFVLFSFLLIIFVAAISA